MTQGALFPDPDPAPTSAAPGPVASALAQAVADGSGGDYARRYPVAVAMAEVVARALDRADAKGQAPIVAQLAKSAQLVFAPLGLAPDPLSHPGDPAGSGAGDKEGSSGGALVQFGRPTVVDAEAS